MSTLILTAAAFSTLSLTIAVLSIVALTLRNLIFASAEQPSTPSSGDLKAPLAAPDKEKIQVLRCVA